MTICRECGNLTESMFCSEKCKESYLDYLNDNSPLTPEDEKKQIVSISIKSQFHREGN